MTRGPSGILERQLAELTDVLHRISPDQFSEAAEVIAVAPRVFLAGRGRNGLALRGFGNRLAQLGKPVAIIGDILTGPVETGDLVVVASASGTTPALLDITGTARTIGARILALTGSHYTPLSAQSDASLTIPAVLADGRSSMQPLGTLFEQSLTLVCDAMIVHLMRRLNVTVDSMRTRHANIE